jgi:putative ABC transport system ATP-binding protein
MPTAGDNLIRFLNVSVSYPTGPPVLRDLTAGFARGSFNLVQGPSGSGKTTLLRLINRLVEPTEGEIVFKGMPLTRLDPPLLRTAVVYVQQLPTAVPGSVADNLYLPFGFKRHRGKSPPGRDRLKELLAEFRLEGVDLDHEARALSVGQLQRICFVRAMLLSPEVLLLDEPASGLDEETGRVVERTAERLCSESSVTIILVSHRPFQPETVVPSLFHLAGGRLEERPWEPA